MSEIEKLMREIKAASGGCLVVLTFLDPGWWAKTAPFLDGHLEQKQAGAYTPEAALQMLLKEVTDTVPPVESEE